MSRFLRSLVSAGVLTLMVAATEAPAHAAWWQVLVRPDDRICAPVIRNGNPWSCDFGKFRILPIRPEPAKQWINPIRPEPAKGWISPIRPEPAKEWISPIRPEPAKEWISPIRPEPAKAWISPLRPTPPRYSIKGSYRLPIMPITRPVSR